MTLQAAQPRRALLAELSAAAIARMRPFAVLWMVGVVIVNAGSYVLKKPTLAPYPGTADDTIMKLVTTAAVLGTATLALKLPITFVAGPALERWLRGNARTVRMRDMFNAGIRKRAILGGAFNAVYNVMFYGLVAYLSPAALASARACVFIPLGFIELHARIIKQGQQRATWWLRFASSGVLTLIGAGIVVFDGGFKLFQEKGIAPIALLIALVTVGNLLLAYAEYHEYYGVRDNRVAAPVYSAARMMYYAVTLVAIAVAWGCGRYLLGTWSFGVMWHTLVMCADRWLLILPIALGGALVDMSRMCVKVVISATFMYIVGASSAMADVFMQHIARYLRPDIYDNVPAHWYVAACGVAIIIVATCTFPHVKGDTPNALVRLYRWSQQRLR